MAGIAGDEAAGLDRIGNAGLRGGDHALADGDVAGDPDLPGQRDLVLDRRCCRRRRPAPPAARCGRLVTPWATWTRLSIFVPAPMRVSPTAGRSTVVLAPISTSSSMHHAADLRESSGACRRGAARSRSRRCRSRRRPAGRPGCRGARARGSRRWAWMTQSSPISAYAADRSRADERWCARRSARPRRRTQTRRRWHRRRPWRPPRPARAGARPAAGRQPSANTPSARANARYGSAARSDRAGNAGDCRRGNHRRCARVPERVGVFGVGEERQVARAGILDGRDPRDLDVAVPLERAVEAGGQIAQLHVDTAVRSKKVTRCSSRKVAATAWTRGSRCSGSSPSTRRSSVKRRGRLLLPGDPVQAPARATKREIVPDHPEGEVIADEVRAGNSEEDDAQHRHQYRVDRQPIPVFLEVATQLIAQNRHRL